MSGRHSSEHLPDILAESSAAIIDGLASSHALLAFDFDGTLAPIVRDRDAARMRPTTRALLIELAGLYSVAIVSGRGLADLAPRVADVPVVQLVGGHGHEWSPPHELGARTLAGAAADVALLQRRIAPLVASIDALEDKTYSLSVHVDTDDDVAPMAYRIAEALEEHALRARLVPGIRVVNVLPADAPNKGDALVALLAPLVARGVTDRALFIGDDVTDEDAFARRVDQPIVAVRVGPTPETAASHVLRDQRAIDTLLERLIEARRRLSAS